MKPSLQFDRYWKAGEDLLVFCLLLFFYCFGLIKNVPFYGDEALWIPESAVFETYFTGNFSSPLWDESYRTFTQPPLTSYLIGVVRLAGGIGSAQLNDYYDWAKSYDQNVLEGKVPSNHLLFWSRLPMAIFAVLAILISFLMLKKVLGRLPGYIWIGLCLISSYFSLTLRRALSESPLLGCVVLAMFIAFLILKTADDKRPKSTVRLYFSFIAFGISAGLAESAKLNGLSILAAGFFLSALAVFRMKQIRILKIRFMLFSSLLLVFSSQITWVALNPFLWPDPVIRTEAMFYYKWNDMHLQADALPQYKIEGIDMQIKVDAERIFQTHSAIKFNNAWLLNITLFLTGISFLIVKSCQYFAHIHPDPTPISFLLVGATASLPALFSPLDWERYFLLPVFFSTMFIAVGIGFIFSSGYRLFLNIIQSRPVTR